MESLGIFKYHHMEYLRHLRLMMNINMKLKVSTSNLAIYIKIK